MKLCRLILCSIVLYGKTSQSVEVSINCSCESDLFHSTIEDDQLTSEFEIRSRSFWHCSPKPHCKPHTSHLTAPEEAIPFEADSVLAGVIKGNDAKATALTSLASLFSISSCILGLNNLFKAHNKKGEAKKLLSKITATIESLHTKQAETEPKDPLAKGLILEQLQFYTQVREKIIFYLRHENFSIALNAVISTGTFCEFIGFLSSESMLGHDNIYSELASVSHYFLAGGLLVVSTSSFTQGAYELYERNRKKHYKIPGFSNDILILPSEIDQHVIGKINIQEFQCQVVQKLKKTESTTISQIDFNHYVQHLFKDAIKKRASQHNTLGLIKICGQTCISLGTAIFSSHQIQKIRDKDGIPDSLAYISGAITATGVALSCLGFWYDQTFVKTPPIMYSLHDEEIDMLRLEIMSLLLKLNLETPKTTSFNDIFSYLKKLIPIDDFSKRQGRPEHIPFLDEQLRETEDVKIEIEILNKFYKKDILYKLGNYLLEKYIKNPFGPEVLAPFILIESSKKKGVINWHTIVEYAYLENSNEEDIETNQLKERAQSLLHDIHRKSITLAIHALEEELNVTIDAYLRLLRQKK